MKPFFTPAKEVGSPKEGKEKKKKRETAEDVKIFEIQPKAPCTYNPVTGLWRYQNAAQLQLTAQSILHPRKR